MWPSIPKVICLIIRLQVNHEVIIIPPFSLKHPAKYIGKKPRKYTIPAKPLGPQGQLPQNSDQVRIYSQTSDVDNHGGMLLHSAKYARVKFTKSVCSLSCFARTVSKIFSHDLNSVWVFDNKSSCAMISNWIKADLPLLQMNVVDRSDIDDDLDEPMASQSVDSEAPLTHNSSKSNFFASPDEPPMNSARGSFKNSVTLKWLT